MNQPIFSVAQLKELMDAFSQSGMGCMEYKQGEFALKMKRTEAVAAAVPQPQPALQVAVSQQNIVGEEPVAELPGIVVTSPIVGTFYEAPAPDKPPFVKVGQQVKKGDVLFIIESMKLMNEVLSEHDGKVAEILVENAQGVEYGQPVLRLE